ncbi:DUF4159 domain-containing protein [Balneolaceae bacterium ANBcel3]|nr:DUF4159 domain-containing protein [Balneolaceae bacterium ANBcel3]
MASKSFFGLVSLIFISLLLAFPSDTTSRNQPVEHQAVDRNTSSQDDRFRIARIRYRGGGDWYNDPSALTNLADFAVRYIPISIDRTYDDVDMGSRDIFQYPFLFMTGHGNIDVNESEAANMRSYLDNGGFLYIDDDYGFDPYVRPVIQKIFPDEDLVELPASYPIYSMVFDFPDGLPKIHEHDGKPPQGFGIFRNGRLVLYYTYESNLADGWAYDVHDNPEHITEKALRMGVNLLVYAFTR